MTAPCRSAPVATGWPDHAVCDDRPAVLAGVLLPHVTLAVWRRAAAPPVPDRDALAILDDIALTTTPVEASGAVRAALHAAGYPETIVPGLADDIAGHAGRLADLLDRPRVAIRLDVIETDACRRFHADYVAARLICTYAGPGTQWLDQADAVRLRDGAPVDTLGIHGVATGDVAVFKGRDWAGDAAIVHRSPPIAATGGRRLMLVIDGG